MLVTIVFFFFFSITLIELFICCLYKRLTLDAPVDAGVMDVKMSMAGRKVGTYLKNLCFLI